MIIKICTNRYDVYSITDKQMFVKTNVRKQVFEKKIDKNICSVYTG